MTSIKVSGISPRTSSSTLLHPAPRNGKTSRRRSGRRTFPPATGQRARDELRKAGLVDKSGGGGHPWLWHRKVLTHSRVPMSSEQVEQVAYSPEEELTHGVSRQNSNGDAYLLNLLKEEEKLREDASDIPCAVCDKPDTDATFQCDRVHAGCGPRGTIPDGNVTSVTNVDDLDSDVYEPDFDVEAGQAWVDATDEQLTSFGRRL
jgi:hypothetical protein